MSTTTMVPMPDVKKGDVCPMGAKLAVATGITIRDEYVSIDWAFIDGTDRWASPYHITDKIELITR